MEGASWFAVAVGRGNHPNSGTLKGSSNVTGSQANRHAGIPEPVECGPHNRHPLSPRGAVDVFKDDESRALGFDESDDVSPHTGALSVEPPTPASTSVREVLARESADDCIDVFELSGIDITNVSVLRDVGPAPHEYTGSVRVVFDLPCRPTEARQFKPEIHSTDTGADRAVPHTFTPQ